MKEQFINKVTQSVLLWLEHQISDDGEAYTNVNTQFYDIPDIHSNYYAYSCPYDQFLADESVSGSITPNLLTGIYVSGNYRNVGNDGFIATDFYNGRLYFNHEIENPSINITGNFSVKEVNIMLTTDAEETLLFDTAYKPKMQITQDYNGQKSYETNIPVVFLKYIGGHNEPFAFGGYDACLYKYKAMVFAENLFQLEAIGSILRDKQNKRIPIIEKSENPFNYLGYYSGATYNYDNIISSKQNSSDYLMLERVYVNNFDAFTIKQRKDVSRGAQLGIIDLEIMSYRYT